MARVIITTDKLDALADSISTKSGEATPLTLDEMKTAVDGIQPGTMTLQTKSESYTPSETAQSDEIEPDAGYDALEKVSVSVGAISSTYVGSGITQRTSSDLSASGATVTAPSGHYASNATKTISSGSASPAASISATGASVSTGTNTLTLSKSVSNTPTVSAGYVSSGTAGNSSVSLTASVTTKAAATITPGTSDQTIASGTYLTGTQTISGDANLVAGNIKSGASIFGVSGTYDGGGGGGSVTQDQDGYIVIPSTGGGGGGDPDENLIKYIQGTLATVDLTGVTQIAARLRYAQTGDTFSVVAPNLTELPAQAFHQSTKLVTVSLPNVTTIATQVFYGSGITTIALPSVTTLNTNVFASCASLTSIDLGNPTSILASCMANCSSFTTLVIRKTNAVTTLANVNAFNGTPFASGGTGGTIYIPKALYDHLGDNSSSDYKHASNWVTVDGYGTITWAKIEGSYYETHYADGTAIS